MKVNVVAKQWEHGWELHVKDVGVTQSGSLATAARMVQEYVASMLDVDDENAIEVSIVATIDQATDRRVREAKQAVVEAAERQLEAAHEQRTVAQLLCNAGLSGSEVAVVLGVSKQRASQLIHS